MTLWIHDTIRRKKVVFEPINPSHIRIYVCGPTVYDYAHVGNARPVVIFDVLVRLLRHLYPKVTYVRNITDVDDKINARSLETGEDIRQITERTARAFRDDMAELGACVPDVEPRATEHISQMIVMIETLIKKKHAYVADGHVLFSVPSMPDYGSLSHLHEREIVAGARVDTAPYKRDLADFVLWKPSEVGVPGWESPWGYGRPGWHIECSAMSLEYLGESFDIHGGGQDLIFPHHENEIAQSTCALGEGSFARYWMHNGYLMSEGEKMSKSLGNFYTANSLLREFPGESIRLLLLQTHYRKPLDFTRAGIVEARHILDKWYRLIDGSTESKVELPEAFFEALCDDLNTPQALAELHKLASIGEIAALSSGAKFLGLLGENPEKWFKWQPAGDPSNSKLNDDKVNELIAERDAARSVRDFKRSDKIRDILSEHKIVLEDSADKTTWRRT
ncbi:MAG: cysteine--tRNA ligase [Rhodospirillaceae bacterium TMED8]|nr:cysteine--tRNA ligase [Magnetovibrio sp.]OUT48107.1 MAG: cysteine--tRNA ligase [Rhodospirillaceae bacterium TMED8]|tara:strand:+ start:1710 stop:3056 length:1347 start_codon:yes stop_codon:yes gene_type:complete